MIFKANVTTKVFSPELVEMWQSHRQNPNNLNFLVLHPPHPPSTPCKIHPLSKFMAPIPMLHIFKAKEGFCISVLPIFSLFYHLLHYAFYTINL
jgi:hypothetical protein